MWTAIDKYPGYYADENGNICSTRSGSPLILSKRLHNGYFRVNIFLKGKPKVPITIPVHTLVLMAFVGERPDGMVCRHLNGNALDNRLSNLRWGTPRENMQDAIQHGTAACLRHGEQAIASKLKLVDILEIRQQHSNGQPQKDIAEAFGISQHHVSDIVHKKTWKQAAP